MRSVSGITWAVQLLAAGLLWLPAAAQFTHPACPDLKATDFRIEEIFNRTGQHGVLASDSQLSEPVQFDIHAVKRGDTTVMDIYFVERKGLVKHYDAAAGRINTLGSISTRGRLDNGVMGIALHPDFTSNRWIYIWYSPRIENDMMNRRLKLTRFTLKPDNTLDLDNPKDLYDIQGSKSDEYHSGGPMQFDGHGDLWVTVGNNSPDLDPSSVGDPFNLNVMSRTDTTASAEWGPSSTANLRGGIFRIHPDSSEKGYRIPKGNFGEYWAAEFDRQQKPALAAEYRDPLKVLPEIYVKGSRSNYSLSVHPVKRWLVWGEVNYGTALDEFNLVTRPTFAGYPYFHHDNSPTGNHGMTPDAPRNTSPFNQGVTELPPAMAGTLNNGPAYGFNVAISGPLYVFDPYLDSRVKFPMHLHNTWITFSFQFNQMHIHSLDSVEVKVAGTQRVDNRLFTGIGLRSPVQAKYGPDGALYILYYDGQPYLPSVNPAIRRIEYTGACNPVSIRPAGRPLPADFGVAFKSGVLRVDEDGIHAATLTDLRGAVRWQASGKAGAEYRLADLRGRSRLETGVYTLRVRTARGTFLRNLSLF